MQETEIFDIGDKVKHPKFGTGTIMFRTGEGEKQKVTVKFGSDVGEKKLLVEYAKLKRIVERPTLEPEATEAVPGRAKLTTPDDDDDDDPKSKGKAGDDDEDDDEDEDEDDDEDEEDDDDEDDD